MIQIMMRSQVKPSLFLRRHSWSAVDKMAEAYKKFADNYVNRKDKYQPQFHFGKDTQLLIKSTYFDDCQLPSQLFAAQENISAPHVFLERCSAADINRDDMSISLVKQGETVGIIGYPGEGKSSLTNRAHMTILDDLFVKDGVKCLFVRHDGNLLRIEKSSASTSDQKLVTVHAYLSEIGSTFSAQLYIVSEYQLEKQMNYGWSKPGDVVFIAEFMEIELMQIDLEGMRYFGLLFTASNCSIEGLTKYMFKSGQSYLFIVDRMNAEQAEKCCEVMYQLEPETCKWAYDINGKHLSQKKAMKVIKDRMQIVGPNLQYLTGPNNMFRPRVLDMEASARRALSKLYMSFTCMSDCSSLYFGLALRPHVTVPHSVNTYGMAAPEYFKSNFNTFTERERNSGCYHFTFVSEYAKSLILKGLENVPSIKSTWWSLECYNLAYPLQQYLVKHALFMKKSDPFVRKQYSVSKWEFVRDSGSSVQLTSDLVLSREETKALKKELKQCTCEELYAGHYLKKTVAQMEPGVLYRSRDAMVGTSCMVNSDKSIITYVFIRLCSNHERYALTSLNLRTIALNHQIGRDQEYFESCRLRVLYVTGWDDEDQHGTAVKYTPKSNEVVTICGSDDSRNNWNDWQGKAVYDVSEVDDQETEMTKMFDFSEWKALVTSRTGSRPASVSNAGYEKSQQMSEMELLAYPPVELDWLPNKVEQLIVRARIIPGMSYVRLKKPTSSD